MKDEVGAHGCMTVVVLFSAIAALIAFFGAILFGAIGIINVIAGMY